MAIVDIQSPISKTGKTARFLVIRASDGYWWNQTATAAFEAYNAANYTAAKYLVSMTETGATAYYRGTFPATIAANTLVNVVVKFDASAGTPVLANDEVAGSGTYWWDGTDIYPVASADVKRWLGTAAATPNTAGVPKIDLIRIDGNTTSGNNATLYLKQLHVSNDAGSAIVANGTGGSGIIASGDGSGNGGFVGANVTSGGYGMLLTGNAANLYASAAIDLTRVNAIGTPAGASIADDVAAVKADTGNTIKVLQAHD